MGQDEWIRRYRAGPEAAVQLVCLPHAGGSAAYFRPLAMALSPTAEVLAVQYPGRMDRIDEPYAGDFEELTERTLAAVRHGVNRPIALFGHSMGALLAFRVAGRLEDEGIVPSALFASGAQPPGRPLFRHTRAPSDEELLADLATLGGTDERLLDDPDMRGLVLSALRADYRILETFQPSDATVSCPVVSLTGDEDPVVQVDDAGGWEEHTTGRFDLHVFPGRHFYLDDHWAGVSAVVARHLTAHKPARTG